MEHGKLGLRFTERDMTDKSIFDFLYVSADVDGTLEAILNTLSTYNSKLCRLDLVHFGVGNVSEKDVDVAKDFDGKSFHLL